MPYLKGILKSSFYKFEEESVIFFNQNPVKYLFVFHCEHLWYSKPFNVTISIAKVLNNDRINFIA